MVTKDDLERSIAKLESTVSNPIEGIYGPRSRTWEMSRESVVFLGGVSAALLQLAHPYVAYGVAQHSHTRGDPLGRFTRTFEHVHGMVFGDLDHATRSSRRVHAIHERVTGQIEDDVGRFSAGSAYRANVEDALMWVYATLIHTAFQVYERCVKTLSVDERESAYAEAHRFAALFGIPQDAMPEDFVRFEQYMDDMFRSETLAVSPPALEMRRFLLQPPNRVVAPVFRWIETMTAGFLPARFQNDFDFKYGVTQRFVFGASTRVIRATLRVTPRRLRYSPAYHQAMRRIEGNPAPDRIAALVERLAHGALARLKPPEAETPQREGPPHRELVSPSSPSPSPPVPTGAPTASAD